MNASKWVMALIAAAIVAAAAHLAFGSGTSGSGDLAQPEAQPRPLDDIARFTSYHNDGAPGHVCEPAQHHAGYTYTPHRYPRAVGGEITAVLHHGFAAMRVPSGTPDEQWIIAPPSEAAF